MIYAALSEVVCGLGDFDDSSPPPVPNAPNDTGEEARIEAMFGWLSFELDNYTEMLHVPNTSKRAVGVQATRLPGIACATYPYLHSS